jgi:cytochrome c-type biogenesis protein CcmE
VFVNKRARNRLIGVTVIVLAIIAAIFFGLNPNGPAYFKTVSEIAKDPSLVGKRVQVGGPVVSGSWDTKTRPMKFAIQDENATGGPTLKVVYAGAVPNTFGDGVVAIVTGQLKAGNVLDATELVTKCPEKGSVDRTKAMALTDLLAKKTTLTGKPVQVVGFVAAGSFVPPGSDVRFKAQTAPAGGDSMPVKFDGAVPVGFKDGIEVALGGALSPSGVFNATSVSLVK